MSELVLQSEQRTQTNGRPSHMPVNCLSWAFEVPLLNVHLWVYNLRITTTSKAAINEIITVHMICSADWMVPPGSGAGVWQLSCKYYQALSCPYILRREPGTEAMSFPQDCRVYLGIRDDIMSDLLHLYRPVWMLPTASFCSSFCQTMGMRTTHVSTEWECTAIILIERQSGLKYSLHAFCEISTYLPT